MSKRKIIVAKHAGFCFGVKRAVEIAEKALESGKKTYCVGHLIHNNQVIDMLKKNGLIMVKNISDIPSSGVMIIRSHGMPLNEIKKAEKKKIEILDATCPFVKKAQIVAKDFCQKGYDVVICGDSKHAEVIGINSHIKNLGIVIKNPGEVKKIKFRKNKIGILSQTTEKKSLLREVVGEVMNFGIKHIEIENTNCIDSQTKQQEVQVLAKNVNAMIIVGGKFSNNTNKLFELAKKICKDTHHIETEKELKKEWFLGVKKIGIAAGASTADFLIDNVVKGIRSL